MMNIGPDAYQVWFPGESVWELWFVDRRKGARLVDTCPDSRLLSFRKGIRKRVLAMPAGNQVSLSFSSNAFGEGKLAKHARRRVLESGIKCDLDGIGVQPISGLPPKTLARVDIPSSGKRIVEFSDDISPDLIVPAAALLPIPSNGVAVWIELRKPVFAAEKHGSTIYYQSLQGDRDIELAREIRTIVDTLRADNVIDHGQSLSLWSQSQQDGFRNVLAMDVSPGVRPGPSNLQPTLGMRPERYRERQVEKSNQKRRVIKKCLTHFALLSSILFITGAYTLAYLQTKQQRVCLESLLPEAKRIGVIKSQWEEMAPAVDRSASLLETWRRILTMPNSANVSISRMAIGKDAVELTCQAKNKHAALRYIDDLGKLTSLAAFSWDYTVPEIMENGTTLFVLKGFK